MRKASRIILLISAILSIVAVVASFITMIVFFVMGSDAAVEEFVRGGSTQKEAEDLARFFTAYAIIFLVLLITSLVNIPFTFIARAKQTTVSLVLAIITSVLSLIFLGALGAIFGIVANFGENNDTENLN